MAFLYAALQSLAHRAIYAAMGCAALQMNSFQTPVALLLTALLAACTSLPPVEPWPGPTQWHAPLPHDGQSATLTDWWRQFDDPQLAALIDDAERSNPTLALASARILQARAGVRAAQAARWPSVDGNA